MPYGYRPQRPGGIDPNDPRKKRLPLTPEEDPYGGIVPDFEVELPEPVSPLPQVPLTQPSTIGMQTGAKLPMEQWQTPPRDLTSLRAWYSGAADVPGAPPAPEWGKRTPTYSRLNPPPPRQMQAPTPAPSPTAPVGFMAPRVGSVNDALQAQMQAPLQQAAIQARQPVTTRPTLGTPSQPTVSPADRQRFTLAEAERRALRNRSAVQGAGQYLQEAGMGDLSPDRFAPMPQPPSATPPQPASWRERAAMQSVSEGAGAPITQGGLNAVSRRAQEALLMGSAGAAAGSLALGGGKPGYRTVPQIARDVSLEFGAGTLNLGGMAADAADIATRSMGMMNPSYDPKAPGGFQALRDASANINKASETLLAQRTPEYLQRRAAMERQLAVAPQDVMSQIAAYAAAIYEDPSMAEQAIVTNLPQMFPSLAAGKIASLGKAAQALKATRALSATAGVGLVQTAVDSAKSSYDTLKQQYMQQGMSSQQADQLAFQNSLPSFIVGGGIGAFTGGTGAEAALFKGGAAGLGQRAARIASELGGEVLEETAPQAITNVQLGRPVTQGLGRTIAETMVATAPFAGMAGMGRTDGGANKVPDALQTETGPTVQPPTGQFGGVIPPSAERQAYETWTQAGGPRAPEAYQVLRKSRSLPGQLGLPPVGLPPVGMPEGQAPQRPTAPLGPAPSPTVTPRTQVPTQPAPDATETEGAPFTFRPLSTVGRPEARPVSLFERPILQTTLEGQGAPIAQRIEEELPLIRDEYAETGRVYQKRPRKGEVGEEGPTAGNVRGEYGKLAYFMHRTPSGVLKKAVSAYDLEPTEKVEDAYEPVMNAIVADMQQLVPGVTASDVMASAQATAKARRALPPEVANIWESWYERFGQDRGFTEGDLNNLKELTAGRRGPFFRPDVQAVMGVDPGDVEANKQTQTAIRQDLARLMKVPYDEISLTTVPPAIWQNWMSLRGLNDERQFPGLKAQMQEIFDRYNEEVRGVKPSPPSPPSAPAGAAPTTPTKPTPPRPAAPAAPSPLVTRYQSQVGRGVSRAPLAFQPRSYTEGVASIERARAEREEARQARERLKKGSPFAKARQAEEAQIGEVIEGRRPEPPAATEPVTPKPTPPAPPAPAGEAVTPPPARRKATPAPAPKPAPAQPISEKTLTDRGWNKQDANNFTGPNGEKLQRDPERRGQPWVYTDRSGNTQSFDSGKEAIRAIISEPETAPPSRVKPTVTEPTPTGKPTSTTPATAESAGTTPAGPIGMFADFAKAQALSMQELRDRISNVRHGGFKDDQYEIVRFMFDGKEYEGVLKGRNQDLMLGMSEEADRGIAARVLLDRDAAPTPAPETPVTPKTTKPRKAKAEAEAAPVPQTTQAEGSGQTEAGTSRLTKPKPKMPPRGLPLLFEFRRLNPNLITTLEGYRDSLSGTRRVELDELLQLRRQKEDSKALPRQEASRAFPSKAQRRLRELNESFEDAEFNIRATAVLARFISAAVPIPAREIKATEYRPAIVLPQGYVLEGDRYVYKRPIATVPQTTQAEEGELPVAEFARQQEQVAARREAFLKDNPDLILTAEDYVKTLAPDVQQRYAKYKALQAKFEAAKQAGSQVRFGATSGKQLKELTRELEFISKEVGRAKGVLSAVIDREPVNASTVDALGIKLPDGYQRQGTQFVYEEKAATPTPATTEQAVAEARKLMRELAAELNLPENLPLDKLVSAAQKKVREAEKAAPTTAATEVPTEVRQIFDTLDLPQGKKSKTRKIVEAMHPDLGKKAIFVNDNIEQIIAEAEANGKVTKECP